MKTKKKKIITALVILIIVFLASVLIVRLLSPEDNWLCDKLGDCVKHGQPGLPNPASVNCEEVGGTLEMKSDASGGQIGFCILPDKSVCEEWSLLRHECTENSENFIHLSLRPGDKISSPLKISGEVRGNWFFEASFPVVLVNWDGLIIAEGLAKAKGDWMTTNFVPFETELKFIKPANPTNQDYAKKGAIIFQKDNPSGLSQHDKAYELPIKF